MVCGRTAVKWQQNGSSWHCGEMSEDWRDLEIQIEREEEIANRIFQFECFCLPHRTNCWSFYFGRRHLIWLFKFKSLPCITSFGLGYLIGRSGWMIGDGQRALGEHWRWELEHWVSIWWWAPLQTAIHFLRSSTDYHPTITNLTTTLEQSAPNSSIRSRFN